MSTVARGFGVANLNAMNEIMRISEVSGPLMLAVKSQDANDAVLSVWRKSDSTRVALVEDTTRTAENTGYTGNGTDLVFSAQSLNNVPIVPGSVNINPTTGGATVDATDVYGDGVLWSSEATPVEVGTINYFTGALYLSYPAGKAPNTGAISATYASSLVIESNGIKAFTINHLSKVENEVLIIEAAAQTTPVRLRIDVFQVL